ncbi:hypothetical protein CBR_g61496 [Chara braunii]|uniref:Integrase zinc-binding domain-containing protein n=1 Tax=Chara braunii TaxID=69332 RepID=A0A388K938_CHABU|nr:hypothetical protein CBR_g61496 [Chara braunii]|eukprot:GBG66453.1 hypothetical protein CBR_g61496 [Chara braunii]
MRKLEAKDKARSDEFVLVDGLMFLEKAGNKRLCVSCRESVRILFLGECHDATGHFGYKKTTANLVHKFWWPTMMDDAKKYVETCQVCQRGKPRTQTPLGLIKPLPIPAGLGQSVSMDFMDSLVTSKSGKRHIFVIVDTFSKYARLIAMLRQLFMDNWQMELVLFLVRKLYHLWGSSTSTIWHSCVFSCARSTLRRLLSGNIGFNDLAEIMELMFLVQKLYPLAEHSPQQQSCIPVDRVVRRSETGPAARRRRLQRSGLDSAAINGSETVQPVPCCGDRVCLQQVQVLFYLFCMCTLWRPSVQDMEDPACVCGTMSLADELRHSAFCMQHVEQVTIHNFFLDINCSIFLLRRRGLDSAKVLLPFKSYATFHDAGETAVHAAIRLNSWQSECTRHCNPKLFRRVRVVEGSHREGSERTERSMTGTLGRVKVLKGRKDQWRTPWLDACAMSILK